MQRDRVKIGHGEPKSHPHVRGDQRFESALLQRRVSNKPFRRWASMEPRTKPRDDVFVEASGANDQAVSPFPTRLVAMVFGCSLSSRPAERSNV